MNRIKEYSPQKLQELLDSPEPLLLHFGTDWCTPCKRLERVILSVHEAIPARLGKVNVEDNPEVAREHSVTKNPTLCLFKDGQVVDRHEGFLESEALLTFVRRNTD